MQHSGVQTVLDQITRWARATPDIQGVLLVGSHARGTPRPDSDIDLLLLTDNKCHYLSDLSWLESFGKASQISREEWGVVTSYRVRPETGPDLEISLATPDWASTTPLDSGTERVVRDGARILYDPKGFFERLLRKVSL